MDVEQALRLGSIELTERGIAERTREGHRVTSVPRSEIERLTLAHGFTSERPIPALIGALVCLGGAAAMAAFSIASLSQGEGYVILAPMVMLTVVGASLLWTLLRRGRYLRVDTARGTRKLFVEDGRDLGAAYEVLQVASSRWGYAVEPPSPDEAWPTRR